MEYVVVSVWDRAADGYGRPIFAASIGLAVRSFQDEVNRADINNPMNQHPKDFELFLLAKFDDATGKFNGVDQPERLATGLQCVITKQ